MRKKPEIRRIVIAAIAAVAAVGSLLPAGMAAQQSVQQAQQSVQKAQQLVQQAQQSVQKTGTETAAAAELSEVLPLAAQSLLLDAVQVQDRVVVVGDRGHILLNGAPASDSWTQVTVPTRSMLTAVTADADGALWAVGHDAVILSSRDKGESWQLQNRDAELEAPLLDVWFESGGHGFAVGAYGLAYETFDGGENWERRSIDEDEPHFYSLFETAGRDLILTGEFGTILRSSDRGETWTRLESPYEGSFFGGLGLSDGSILLFGLRGHLYRSSDRGESWQEIDSGVTASLLDGAEGREGEVMIVGLSGTLLRSEDDAESFTLTGGLKREAIASLLPLSGGGLLLLGERGVLLLRNAAAGQSTELAR